jgi:hypothetical protein
MAGRQLLRFTLGSDLTVVVGCGQQGATILKPMVMV